MTSYLLDTNVWLALTISGHVHHDAAVAWFDELDQSNAAHFCRATQQSYLRLLTTAAFADAMAIEVQTNEQAWAAYAALEADDRVAGVAAEPAALEQQWRRYALRGQSSPKLWMDAYLAAFARRHGSVLVTTDRAFAQFTGVDIEILSDRARA